MNSEIQPLDSCLNYARRGFLQKSVVTGATLGIAGAYSINAFGTNSGQNASLLTNQSATELARLIREKKVSSKEVVQAYLERIDNVNPAINAVVQIAREEAIKEADQADNKLATTGPSGPLHGVPMTIKDSFDTAGVVSTAGTKGRKNYVPKKDATVVARLKSAGAILLGKTNTPEMTFSYHTQNKLHGRTNNPYDLERSPGGSSGGAAAILAAGGSPFDIGSDTAGSIRLPAHWCGIAGLKPTSGRVPRTGHVVNHTVGVLQSLTTIGPLARTVSDLETLFSVIAGVDGHDPAIVPVKLYDSSLVDIGSLKVAFYSENGSAHPTEETKATVGNAAKEMEKAGAEIKEGCPPPARDSSNLFERVMFGDDRAWYRRGLVEVGTITESDMKKHTPNKTPVVEFSKSLADWNLYQGRMLEFMQDFDVILCPVQASPAPLYSNAWKSGPGYSYTQTYSLTGWPSVVVRCGTSPEEMPIGLQIVAAPWREDISLAVAKHLEMALGGWKAPKLPVSQQG